MIKQIIVFVFIAVTIDLLGTAWLIKYLFEPDYFFIAFLTGVIFIAKITLSYTIYHEKYN